MCGISGMICAEAAELGDWLQRSAKAQHHRGPDDAGFLVADDNGIHFAREVTGPLVGRIGLAHRRLSIIDLSPLGRQPMASADGQCAVCFNGEIYNYRELRREAEQQGAIFRSSSDTEVLLHYLQREGAACLPKLRGMFAFCFINLGTREFLLARDPFGIKPLYLAHGDGKLAFASEMRALRMLPWVDQSLVPQVLYNFLRFGVADDSRSTLLKGVVQLPPASYLSGSLDQPFSEKPIEYWKPKLGGNAGMRFEDAAVEMRERFLNSVRIHLRSDVPVGAALSGGVDSSAIVCAMRHLEPDLDLHTFTYAPQGFHLNEEKWATLIAQETRATQHLTDFSTQDLIGDLDRLLQVQEDPLGSTSIYAQYRIFQKVSETPVKVMLDGQGGDETLAGYPIYFGAHLASLVRNHRWAQIKEMWRHRKEAAGGHRVGWLMAGSHFIPKSLQNLSRRLLGKELFPAYLRQAWFEAQGVLAGRLENPIGPDGMPGMLWDTMNRTGLPQLLHFEDRNSMNFSIESRVPFLETDFVEFALSLPGEYHISSAGEMKHLFKSAMRGLVPDVILNRKDKIGFHTPGADLLLQAKQWVENSISRIPEEAAAIIDEAGLRKAWEAVQAGKLNNQQYQGFWRVLAFLRWLQLRD